MSGLRGHPDMLKRRVVFLFFAGLLLMATFALTLGWACGDWGMIRLGWLN